jgi:hypothetical protein
MKPADKMKRLRLREKHDLVAVRDDICREDLPAFEELARKAKEKVENDE